MSLSSEKAILRRNRNVAQLRRDEAKAREAFSAAQNSKLDQQLADIQKHVVTIRRFLPQYRSNLSSNIE